MGKKSNTLIRIITIILLILLIIVILGYLWKDYSPQITNLFAKKVVIIDWTFAGNTKCWNIDKQYNALSGNILQDCTGACSSKYHLVAKDYDCNTQNGNVTCICSSPS